MCALQAVPQYFGRNINPFCCSKKERACPTSTFTRIISNQRWHRNPANTLVRRYFFVFSRAATKQFRRFCYCKPPVDLFRSQGTYLRSDSSTFRKQSAHAVLRTNIVIINAWFARKQIKTDGSWFSFSRM